MIDNIDELYKLLREHNMTCLNRERFVSAAQKVCDVIEKNIEGSIVECGTYRCGCLAIMAKCAFPHKRIWGFDTFEGLPLPSSKDGRMAVGRGGSTDLCSPIENAFDAYRLINASSDHTVLVKGLFQETLSRNKTYLGKIAVLRLDGDWYESTKVCLEELYDQVTVGGWIIIDDYGHWPGCKLAVDEFIARRNLHVNLIASDGSERCWIKQ